MQADNSKWRATLGFTDRLNTVVKMHCLGIRVLIPLVCSRRSAYTLANPTASPAEANQHAKVLENDAYSSVISREDYDRCCEVLIHELHQKAKNDVAEEVDHLLNPESDKREDPGEEFVIGKYTQATHYKNGLFSEVYKAPVTPQPDEVDTDPAQSPSFIALKVTVPDMMLPPHDSKKEVRILQQTRSPHVIELLESFNQSGGRLVLVFPFMPYDFAQLLRDGKASAPNVKACLKDMFAAIDYLHERGIIHRDIKPSNLLLKTPSGPTYLGDFGIAWSAEDPAAEPKQKKITDVGTTSYRPPELLFGNTAYDCSLDLWAAGCVVAEATSSPHETLFDSGDLGSELALIQSIFKGLGTPTVTVWPEVESFPDWGKMQFHEYRPQPWAELLPTAPEDARDLASQLVRYQSSDRISAAKVLEHPYFAES